MPAQLTDRPEAFDEMVETLTGIQGGFADNATSDPDDPTWVNGAALLELAKACVYRSMLPMSDGEDGEVVMSTDGRLFVECVTAYLLGRTPSRDMLAASVRLVQRGAGLAFDESSEGVA